MRRLVHFVTLFILVSALCTTAGCRPRVKVKPRVKTNWVKPQPRPRVPIRQPNLTRTRQRQAGGAGNAMAARNRSLLGRVTDAQADALIEGLIKNALGLEDMSDRYRRMNREQQEAVWRRVAAQPQRRGRKFEDLRRTVSRRR